MERRFAILHHRTADGEHWDLLLEEDEKLATWQLARSPLVRPTDPINAMRIFDHRKIYLTYEGPISGDRGDVRRVADGTYTAPVWSPKAIRLVLDGAKVSGVFELTSLGEDRWRFRQKAKTADAPPKRRSA